MKTSSAIRASCLLCAALTLAACGSPYSPGTIADANNVNGSSLPSGPSVLSTSSDVAANVGGQAIPLKYVIYAPQYSASDPNQTYGIEFLDYDPCTWGTEHGWTTEPNTTFNQLGFYFPTQPSVGSWTVKQGGGSDSINTSSGALGVKFQPSPTTLNGQATFTCKATQWLELQSGSVDVTQFDSTAGTMTGTLSITLSDGSTVTGNFQSGSCSETASGGVSEPDTANSCTSEQ